MWVTSAWVTCGSHSDCSIWVSYGQWVKWVNRCDPLSTLMRITSQLQLASYMHDIHAVMILQQFQVCHYNLQLVHKIVAQILSSHSCEIAQYSCSITYSYLIPFIVDSYGNNHIHVHNNTYIASYIAIDWIIILLKTISFSKYEIKPK